MDDRSVETRSRCMSKIKSKNTLPEMNVRRALTDLGVRYRLNVTSLPGKPDIVIRRLYLAVFVNGCFWHQHVGCKKRAQPKSNSTYWLNKLKNNVERQDRDVRRLRDQGWDVRIIWECETKDPIALKHQLKEIISA